MEQQSLEARFEHAMMDIYQRSVREVRYNPARFLEMLRSIGAVATAKKLINAEVQSEGFARLWEEHRLDLTVEAVVVDNQEFHRLFTESELQRANERLDSVGYRPDER